MSAPLLPKVNSSGLLVIVLDIVVDRAPTSCSSEDGSLKAVWRGRGQLVQVDVEVAARWS